MPLLVLLGGPRYRTVGRRESTLYGMIVQQKGPD